MQIRVCCLLLRCIEIETKGLFVFGLFIWDQPILHGGLTGVLEVHVLAVESVLQAVRHDLQLHYLLPYCYVWLGDVDFHLGVVDLTGQAVAHHLRKVPREKKKKLSHVWTLEVFNQNTHKGFIMEAKLNEAE